MPDERTEIAVEAAAKTFHEARRAGPGRLDIKNSVDLVLADADRSADPRQIDIAKALRSALEGHHDNAPGMKKPARGGRGNGARPVTE